MAFTVHIIPTGESIQPPSGQPLNKLDALHAWIAEETGIEKARQVILTGKGKHVLLLRQDLGLSEEVMLLRQEIDKATTMQKKQVWQKKVE